MDDEIEKQVDQAATDLNLSADVFTKCDPEIAKLVVQKAQVTFVIGNPRAWWMSLKYPFDSFDYSEGFGFQDLARHVPPGNEKCWFIPETEEQYPPVFDAEVESIPLVLAQCISFEYYLVGKQFDWLITESDHNQIIVSRVAALTNRT
ncbi:MAG TPA: DUF6756 family protein [Pyrinomonadaceae bacterium]|jgi:hypothetical protein|nr:DUF6756 family protein [Pyrinomonadaceae bacterium]